VEGAWRLLRMRGTWSTIVSTCNIYFSSALTNLAFTPTLTICFIILLVDLYCELAGHYEWHVAFPQLDIDLGAVRARLGKDGDLIIDVPRRRR
jgi:hypothetical protein